MKFSITKKNHIFVFCFFIIGNLFAEPGKFVKDIQIEDFDIQIPDIQKENLGKNIEFYKLPSDELPVCNLEIHLYGGESSVGNLPIETVAIIAGSLKYGGTKKYSDNLFLAKLESLGVKFEIETDYRKIKITLSFLKKDSEEVMRLLSELLTSPAFTENSISDAKRKIAEQIKRRNDSTDSIVFRKTKELIYRGLLTGKSYRIDSLEKVKKENVEDFYFHSIRNAKKAILVSGSYDELKLKKNISEMFSSEKKEKAKFTEEVLSEEILQANFQKYSFQNILVEKPVTQSAVMMVGLLPRHNHSDFYAIQILNYIIGGGGFNSYFMREIRSDRGLAYSAYSNPVFKKDHGYIYFYVQTKIESTELVYNLMKEILSEDRFGKITEKEIQNAKNAIQNQFVFLFSNNSQILSNYLRFSEDEMPARYLENYRKEIGKVTLEDLKRVGTKYFVSNKLKTIVVGTGDSFKFLEPKHSKKIFPESEL
ncbi:MAG: insulinase family protein [Leptospiraceae bacterium]|nr:insulinase family protein [Leptospiraceae bacterium]MCK6379656.1 insulinase family protein [Leptospiraceae bacterium]NUM40110.1 insulinase family protein [Leptospiraceae bacterium]